MLARLQPVEAPPVERQGEADDQAAAARLTNRRTNFFRAERLSLSERSFFPPDFDPGPDYDSP